MPTDIKLSDDDDTVYIQGTFVKTEAMDFMLDNPNRRVSPAPETRRALVHDMGDKLTINYGRDYPGGVAIEGNTKINGKLDVSEIAETQVLSLKGTPYVGGPTLIALKTENIVLQNPSASRHCI